MLVDLEQLDWLWSAGKVTDIMMDLLFMHEKYKAQYPELVIVQRETFIERGLVQSITLCGVLPEERATL